jgi:hypothetical protein
MRPVFRWGNMPKAVAKFHKQWRAELLPEPGEDAPPVDKYAEVWECDGPQEVMEYATMHPLLGRQVNPDKLLHPLIDKDTGRVFLVAAALADRVSMGDIDQTTGELIDGIYEKAPAIVFSECSKSWLHHMSRVLADEYNKKVTGESPAASELAHDFLLEQMGRATSR